MKKTSTIVTVIGMGKIGLPLAAVIANRGYQVIGADIDETIVKLINEGKSHIPNEPHLDELIKRSHDSRSLRATTNTSEAVSRSDVIIVVVPIITNKDHQEDYCFIDEAVYQLAKGIRKHSLVIFETTIPVGQTRERFGKKIEEVSGLKMGKDFLLAYSPERVSSNQVIRDLNTYPKVVSGVNQKSLEKAASFYKQALQTEIIKVSSLETAELTKIAEGIYRDVNIALANELARYADQHGINILEVIKASNTQPYSHIHLPGIGVGGHCIPVYPYFLINKGITGGLIEQARALNESMPDYGVQLLKQDLGSLKGKNILILGLSFRENVKEVSHSSAIELDSLLKLQGAKTYIHDPLFSEEEIRSLGLTPLSLNDEIISHIEVIILQAYHNQYQYLDFQKFTRCTYVLDGRNRLDRNTVISAGIKYRGIGT
ncbi:MAG: nucleotide sugar dehydrogenase [Bacillaceae bacterium]|nr:nucleotide sugar dehydrogenase [Bacillaceae bacterium]